MTLLEKQWLFAESFADLVKFAVSKGFKVSYGETERTKEQAAIYARLGKGIKNSLHLKRLAGDLNLYKDGKYLDETEDHRELGKFWESLTTPNAKHCWGGRFGDGDHYSIEHNGVR